MYDAENMPSRGRAAPAGPRGHGAAGEGGSRRGA